MMRERRYLPSVAVLVFLRRRSRLQILTSVQASRGIILTDWSPTHVESRSKDIHHCQSSNTCWRRMVVLTRLRSEAQVLNLLVSSMKWCGGLTKPMKNMQNAWIAPPNMKDFRRPRESARKKMKMRQVTTLTTP